MSSHSIVLAGQRPSASHREDRASPFRPATRHLAQSPRQANARELLRKEPLRAAVRGPGNRAIEVESLVMHNEFTAIIERDGEWFIAYSPEIPGANGQGRTRDEARANLGEAIALILDDRREDALRGIPADATRETVVVE